MISLFTRVYINLILALVVTVFSVWVTLDLVNRYRFSQFTDHRVAAIQTVLNRNDSAVPEDRLADWSAILSRLTGADWQRADETAETGVRRPRWRSEQADITLPLGDRATRVQAQVADWDELLIGTGYLMVNALSLADVDQREQTLNLLAARSGLPLRPVSLDGEDLGFLQQRQLQQGQAVLVNHSMGLTADQQTLYIPMGQGNALTLGPVSRFEWMTPLGLILLASMALIMLGSLIYLTLRPLRLRLARMTQAVDAIEHTPDSVNVPDTPSDELGAMGDHINRMAARLVDYGRRNKALNQAVSHDLKTPMAQFKFALAMLKPEDRQLYVVDKMNQAIGDMESLVDELLLFHSLSHTPTDRDARTNLTGLIGDVVESLDTNPDMAWQITLPEGDIWVSGEERLMRRLLLNLLTNAVNYGRRTVRVDAHCRENGLVDLTIDDDGPGIPIAERKRVLEPFYRLDPSREGDVRGHGLGLAISQDIVTLLDGTLTLGASDLDGCRVTVTLPSLQTLTMNQHPEKRDRLQ